MSSNFDYKISARHNLIKHSKFHDKIQRQFYAFVCSVFPSNFRDKFCVNMLLEKCIYPNMKTSHAKIFIDNVSCLVFTRCTYIVFIVCTMHSVEPTCRCTDQKKRVFSFVYYSRKYVRFL